MQDPEPRPKGQTLPLWFLDFLLLSLNLDQFGSVY